MPLKIIYGRSKSGKTKYCLNKISASDKALLLVPEQYSFTAEKRFSLQMGVHGMGGAEILSFRRIAQRLLKTHEGFLKPRIDRAGKNMTVYKILATGANKLKFFTGREADSGTAAHIAGLFDEFKRYGVTADMLQEASCKASSPLSEKLYDFAYILSEYTKLVEENYVDAEDDLARLSAFLDSYRGFENTDIYIDQFTGFTPIETECIKKLMLCARSVTVTLCMLPGDSGKIEFYPTEKTAKKLLSFAKSCGISISIETLEGQNTLPPALSHIEREYFSYPLKTFEGDSSAVSVYEARNPYTEVHSVARRILALCREKGYMMRDIAVAGRDLSSYENYISSIFPAYGISFFMDKTVNILSHPVSVFIISALEIATDGFDYEKVFTYAKSGFPRVRERDVYLLENYVLAAGVRPAAWKNEEAWNYRMKIYSETDDGEAEEVRMAAEADAVRRRIEKPLAPLAQRLRDEKTVKGKCEALYSFIENTHLQRRVTAMARLFEKSGNLKKAQEYKSVLDSIYGTITSMVYAMGDENISMKNFCAVLRAGLAEAKIGAIPATCDGVSVGTIGRIAGYSPRALFILGVNEGVFPAAPQADGILSDGDRQTLLSLDIETAPTSEIKLAEEEHLIYTSLTLSTELLSLSYCTSGADGAAAVPSVIIRRIRELLPLVHFESDVLKPVSEVTAPSVTFNALICALRSGETLSNDMREAYAYFAASPIWSERLIAAENILNFKNRALPLSSETADRIWKNGITTSVSRLESFAKCPFAYFAEYTLRAKERKIMQLTAVDAGTFLHNFIDEFSGRLSKNGRTWRDIDDEYITLEIEKIMELMLGRMNYFATESKKYRNIFARLCSTVHRALRLISMHISRGEFEPLGYELSFSENGDIKPLTIKLPTGFKITLTGRIDRADVLYEEDKAYIRIIDYKSGDRDLSVTDVYLGLNLQLAVYMTALCESDKFSLPVKPAAMLYFRLDDAVVELPPGTSPEEIERKKNEALKMRGLVMSDDDMVFKMDKSAGTEEAFLPVSIKKNGEIGAYSRTATLKQFEGLMRHTKKTIAELTARLRSGETDIAPCKDGGSTPCTYCKFKSICCFDVSLGCSFKKMSHLSKEEILDLFSGGEE